MRKILIAEDEPLELSFLHDVLKKRFGDIAEFQTAQNGLIAVQIAQLWKPDIILLDIEMPGQNGLEAACAIRAMVPRGKIAFITAHGKFDYAQQAIRISACDYVLKPVKDETLIAAVEHMLEMVNQETLFAQYYSAKCHEVDVHSGNQRQREIMKRVDEYLCENYKHDISMEIVADIVGLSPSHFAKLFKQCFGTTFIERLTAIRIEQAKKLLKNVEIHIKDIGEAVGYPSITYFTSKFKKETGLPPAEYRRMASE